MTTPFISRGDLGDYMAQDLAASDVAGIAIDAACETIRSFTRRQLNYVADDEIALNGTGHDTLLLPEWPVIGTPAVLLDDVEVTDFAVQGSRLVRTDWGCWDRGVANVAVTYSHGYVPNEADVVAVTGPTRFPSDLRGVALAIAAGLMSVSETRFHTVSPRDTVGGSDPVEGPAPAMLTEEHRSILSSYRNVRVA
jgi:hypothetical protein